MGRVLEMVLNPRLVTWDMLLGFCLNGRVYSYIMF